MCHSVGRFIWFCVLISFLAYYAIDAEHPISSHASKINTEIRWRATYLSTGGQVNYRRPELKLPELPDTTAVILNWSRLPNVVQLVKIMCSSLQDTFAQIFVWNNNPQPLNFEVGLGNLFSISCFYLTWARILQTLCVQDTY